MSLILTKQPGNFVPHPITENPVKAVIVDITPVKEVPKTDQKTGKQYTKNVFRIVYETEVTDEEGKRFCIWSRQYAADGRDPLNEKSNLRVDIKKILGRDLTAQELEGYDVETLLGRSVRLMVDHEVDGDKTYDQITNLKAMAEPFPPSGAYVRVQDRKRDGDASYHKAAAPAAGASTPAATSTPAAPAAATSAAPAAAEDWENATVHLEGYGGMKVCDFDLPILQKLANEELPKLEAKPKKTIADKRLITALHKLKEELAK